MAFGDAWCGGRGTTLVFVLLVAMGTVTSALKSRSPANYGSLATDEQNLRKIFAALNGPTWRQQQFWTKDNNPCGWVGISCVDQDTKKNTGRVTAINLPNNNLNGKLPREIWNLDRLQILWLPNNGITGEISASGITQARMLKVLNLKNNKLTGQIPSTIGKARNLRSINLSNNQLTGMIPNTIGDLNKLTHLTLGGNQWSGAFPAEIGSLIALRSISVENSSLGGLLPTELRFAKNLERIKFKGNEFEGPIPTGWGKLRKLQTLNLQHNKLEGAVLPDLIGMVSLKKAEFTGNLLCFNNDTVVRFFTPRMPDVPSGQQFPLCTRLPTEPEETYSKPDQAVGPSLGVRSVLRRLCPKDGDRYYHCGGVNQCPGHYTYCRLKKPEEESTIAEPISVECPPKYAHCEPLVGASS